MVESSDSATPSLSPTLPTSSYSAIEPLPPPGRPKWSPVWKYFVYHKEDNRSVCQIEVSRDHGDQNGPSWELCGITIAGKFPTNLKLHVRTAHPAQYWDILAKEEELEQKKEASSKLVRQTKQLSIAESLKIKTSYDKNSQRYLNLTKHLAIFIGSTSIPNSIVENLEFRSFVKALDCRYPAPGRTLIAKELDKVLVTLKQNINALMSEARKVSLCADIWSKKGLTSSYLGVTAHLFSRIIGAM